MPKKTAPAAGEAVPVLQTTIAARINGADHTVGIPRDRLHLFEGLSGSANAMFGRIRAGQWTSAEIVAVIDFALNPPAAGTDPIALQLRYRAPTSGVAIDAINARGAGHYAPLAAGILGAALWGLPADVAAFTDEE
ncbi:hypothetical protein [Ensifer soli]|uniref:hypothetical protein n=1 Tax=Ciceribacter sp. sgz301302 TaxID=3342379 RepID=UPI0035BA72C6